MVTHSCVLSDAWFWDLKFKIWGIEIKIVENYFFLVNYVFSEGIIFTMFYTINLSPLLVIKKGFMINNYFE